MSSPSPKTPPKLSSAALRKLRSLGHALAPVVAIGKDGLTAALVNAADAAIGTHELVKIKIQREAPVDRHEAGIEIAARTGSVLVQVIGRTLLVYRRHPKKPKIELPLAGKASKAGKTSKPAKAKSAPAFGADEANETGSDSFEGDGDGEVADDEEQPVDSDGDEGGDPEENP
jgi:RNA-binding protein